MCSPKQRAHFGGKCTCKICRERAADPNKHQPDFAYRYSKVYMPMENTVVIEREMQLREGRQMELEDGASVDHAVLVAATLEGSAEARMVEPRFVHASSPCNGGPR